MIIDCISDLHGFYPKLDGGDLLIIAGDLTARHTEKEWPESLKDSYFKLFLENIFPLISNETCPKNQRMLAGFHC